MAIETPFMVRLADRVRQCGNPVLVGLDPWLASLPKAVWRSSEAADPREMAAAASRFCQAVIDVVAPLVAAVKPQAACFERMGPPGMAALAEVIRYAALKGLLVILDGKRNDIGSTATAYAEAYLGRGSPWGADALTVSPYLGDDSLEPFVSTAVGRHAGVFVLVKTSNPGGKRFQDLRCEGRPLYQHVAQHVEELAQRTLPAGEHALPDSIPASPEYGAVGAVVGATWPAELAELRRLMPHAFFLIPGYGTQGGKPADVAAAFDEHGGGAIINSSRALIFAADRPDMAGRFPPGDWQRAVELATREMIDELRAITDSIRARSASE